MGLTYGELLDTPLGPLSFYAGDSGLKRVAFKPLSSLKTEIETVFQEPSLKGLETVGVLLAELNEYLFGIRKFFSVSIDRSAFSEFQNRVLALTTKIPYGDVRTYGEIALALGTPKGARPVGHALATNPLPIVIPCHRVVGSDHRLRGYAAPDGIRTKAFLLRLEGHTIKDDRLV